MASHVPESKVLADPEIKQAAIEKAMKSMGLQLHAHFLSGKSAFSACSPTDERSMGGAMVSVEVSSIHILEWEVSLFMLVTWAPRFPRQTRQGQTF